MFPRRQERIEELLHQEISRMVQALGDPGMGLVAVTGVAVTRDLSAARVFYSVLGTELEKKEAQACLDRAAGHVRRDLARRVKLRRIPQVEFCFDPTPERAARVQALLNELHSQEAPASPPRASRKAG